MTPEQFYNTVIVISGLMVLVNLLLVRRRGVSAYFLAAGFVVFAATVHAYRVGASLNLISLGVLALMLLLAADFFFRGANRR